MLTNGVAAVLTIASKDLRQRLRDRSAIVLAFVAPLAVAAVMSFAFRGTERFHADVGVVDLDRGAIATAFGDLLAEPSLRAVITARRYATEDDARRAVRDRTVSAAWVLPAGLSAAVTGGGNADLRTLTDVSSGIAGDVATSIARSFAGEVNARRLAIAAAIAVGGVHGDVTAMQAALASMPPTERVVEQATGARRLRAINYYGPGMALFFGFFTIGFTARGWFADRREGMADRVAAAPVLPFALVLGKALSAFVFTLSSLVVMGVVTTSVLNADWGPPLAALAVCVAMACAVTALAVAVIVVARTERQADGAASLAVFGLALFGGNFVFLSAAPSLLRKVSLATPNGWALRAFTDLSTGSGARAALTPILAIGVFTVVVGAIAAVFAPRRKVA